ncbi:MAG TPA: wax ester/triacylglycerol synthase family O-acyltransferase [Solirubrobacteraceae bacterium]|jgi:WS/DGAT/MGAT family acyltransferase
MSASEIGPGENRLSPADRASLQAERGPINMAVAGVLVFEPGLTFERVAARVAERLHLVPRYRQKLDEAPLGLAQPTWIDDAGFDLHWHLRRARVDGDAELPGYVAREMSRRLDRSRPLWELHVVEGLDDGRTAVIPKMHHALVDGLAAVGIGMVLLDPTPEPLVLPEPEEWRPRETDLRRRLTALASAPLSRAQRLVLDSTQRALDTSPRRAAEDVRRATELATELTRARPQAPMTPLNRPISPNRRAALTSAPLAPLKAAGKAAGGTVNDALLAAVAGMLREYLAAAGVDLGGREPVALVPVSIRREGDEGGNRISTVFVDLPIGEPDPAARIATIAAAMRELKGSAAIRAGALLVGATGQAPPVVSSVLVRAMGSVRAFNLVVSNVPGPQQPFYMDGIRMTAVYPAVPLNPSNQGLSVGILSYDGAIHAGLLADARLDPGVDVAVTALTGALTDLTQNP